MTRCCRGGTCGRPFFIPWLVRKTGAHEWPPYRALGFGRRNPYPVFDGRQAGATVNQSTSVDTVRTPRLQVWLLYTLDTVGHQHLPTRSPCGSIVRRCIGRVAAGMVLARPFKAWIQER